MKPEAQRIAIAEACGFTKEVAYYKEKNGRLSLASVIPDYLNDLNAMHEAEKLLYAMKAPDPYGSHMPWLNAGFVYESLIWKIVGSAFLETGNHRAVFCATAAQRAEAFLRTLNLWDDTK